MDLQSGPVDRDVPRQPSEAELPEPWPSDTGGDKDNAGNNQNATNVQEIHARGRTLLGLTAQTPRRQGIDTHL